MKQLVLLVVMALFAFKVQSAPPPGHPSTDQAARALGLPAQQPLPYQGRVLQAMDSNSYVYLEVEGPQQERLWLAAPRTAVAVGAAIRFGQGTLMNNFYSKKLKRTFAQLLFVSRVEVIAPTR